MSAISSISSASATDPSSLLQQQMLAARKAAMDAAAKTLSMSTTDLQQQLQSGQSLKDVASAKGVDFSKVQSAISTAVTPALDQAVQSGSMTSQQSSNLLSKLTSGDAPSKVHKGHHHHGGGGAPPVAAAASPDSALEAVDLATPIYSATGITAQSPTPGSVLNQTA